MNKVKKNLLVLSLSIGVVLIWRGIWGILDVYLFPGDPLISYSISIILGLVILYLHNHNIDELI